MTALFSLLLGFLAFFFVHRYKTGGFQTVATKLIHQAELDCEAKKSELALKLKEMEHANQEKVRNQSLEIKNKQAKLERQLKEAASGLLDLQRREKELQKKEENLHLKRAKLDELKKQLTQQLEEAAKLDQESAKKLLVEKLDTEMGSVLLKQKKQLEEEIESEATRLLVATLPRVAANYVLEATITTVPLPSSDMKGRIIGREGRNIRLLEQLTGVNYLLDESPHAVVLSSTDPIRREVAKLTLTTLLRDGRIHASRIEEAVAKSKKEIETQMRRIGEKAAFDVGITDLHPELIALLGRLHFSYSHGQNLLQHSKEVAYLMGMMAAELKLNSERARRIGLLHDIGKVASSKIEGSHAKVGAALCSQYDESHEVANAIAAHHKELDPITMEASLLPPADTLSASRPGARSEAIDQYVKRMSKMEKICATFDEVEKAYALSSGREVSILVKPDKVSDEAAQTLARQVVKKLEKELSFTGKIKVTVVREKKVIDYAT